MTSRVLLIVFFTVFLDMIGFGIVIPLLPFYVQSMGGSAEIVGLILGAFSLTQMLATPVLGRVSDRYGRRPVILLSLAGNAIAMVIFAFAAEQKLLALFFVSRTLAGMTAGNLSACQAAVADVTDGPERAAGMGRLGAGIGLGMVVGPFLGSVLSRIDAAAPPLAAAALALTDWIAAYFLMPETRARGVDTVRSEGEQRSVAQALRDPRILAVMAMYFLTFLSMANIQVAMPLLANARFGWNEREIGYVFGLFGFMALAVQGGIIGRLSRRYAAVTILVLGALCVVAGMASIAAAYRPLLLVAGVALVGFGIGLTNPTLASLASQLAGRQRQGVILGFAQSAGGAARTVGPPWSGMLYTRAGGAAPFMFGVAAGTLSTLIAVLLRRYGARTGVTE